MTDHSHLQTLLATHADCLLAHLPPGWVLTSDLPFHAWGNKFVVYELGQLPDGRYAKLHHFLAPDTGPPHCHFCDIESFGIRGSYVERTYLDGTTYDVVRPAGGHHTVRAETTHRVADLPQGDAWTLCFTGAHTRQGRHHPELVESH